MIVLGLDPGGKTGVCHYNTEFPRPAFFEVEGSTKGFIEWWKKDNANPFGLTQAGTIVVESFKLDGRTAQPDLTPVEIKGFLDGTGKVTAYQSPSQAKSLITNTILKRAGLYPRRGQVKGGHAVDALRHILYYLVVTLKHRETIELLWPRDA
jgi:hypothetical protein